MAPMSPNPLMKNERTQSAGRSAQVGREQSYTSENSQTAVPKSPSLNRLRDSGNKFGGSRTDNLEAELRDSHNTHFGPTNAFGVPLQPHRARPGEQANQANKPSTSSWSPPVINTAIPPDMRPFDNGNNAPGSPKTIQPATSPLNSTMSTGNWTAMNESLTILDWDDTLFPSTWLTETRLELLAPCPPHRLDILEPMQMQAAKIVEIIQAAKRISQVVILTNSSAGWVHDAVRNFMPNEALQREIDNTPIIYAREEWARLAPDSLYDYYDMYQNAEDEEPLPLSWKKVAMEKLLREFYGPEHSWKNILGVGDSPLDRWALDEVCMKHNNPVSAHTGNDRPMRVKTIKLVESPSIQQLQAECMLLTRYFHGLSLSDGSYEMDIHFNDTLEQSMDTHGPLRWNPHGKSPEDPKRMMYEHNPMAWHTFMRSNPRTVQSLFDNFESLFDPRCVGDLVTLSQMTPARNGYAASRRFCPVFDDQATVNNVRNDRNVTYNISPPPPPPSLPQTQSSPIPPPPGTRTFNRSDSARSNSSTQAPKPTRRPDPPPNPTAGTLA